MTTVEATRANGTVPPSLLESAFTSVAGIAAKRAARRRDRAQAGYLPAVIGTIIAMALLVSAAFFAAGLSAGLGAAGIAVLLIDHRFTMVRRERTRPPRQVMR